MSETMTLEEGAEPGPFGPVTGHQTGEFQSFLRQEAYRFGKDLRLFLCAQACGIHGLSDLP